MNNNIIPSNEFDELVFENRHKEYGAYQIRKRYMKTVFVASLICISFFSSAMILYFVTLPSAMAEVPREKVDSFKIIQIDATPTKPEEPKKMVEQIKTQAPPKGPDNPDLTKPVLTDHPVANLNIDSSGTSSKGKPGGTGPVLDTANHGTGLAQVDTTPKPPVRKDWTNDPIRDPGLDAFFRKNIKYPEMLKEQGIEGTEYLEFVIDINGNPKEFKIVKSSNPIFAKEVLRVAPGMPKFDPVTFDGQPCEFVMRKPIHFTLSK